MAPTEATPRPARLPRSQRREQLLDVAAGLILEKGTEAVTMEGVAAAAGVSKGLGYAYFANSSTLLRALLEREVRKLQASIMEALGRETTFEGKLRATVRAWFDSLAEQGVLLGHLLVASRNEGPHVEARNAYNRNNDDFWAGMAQRELGVPIERGRIAARILLSGLEGLVQRWQCGDSREDLEEVFVQMAMGGLERLRA